MFNRKTHEAKYSIFEVPSEEGDNIMVGLQDYEVIIDKLFS